MVLTFGLCASLAFAQTNSTLEKASARTPDAAVNAEVVAPQAGYTGSIFAKDGELFTCTFSAAEQNAGKFTTGIVGANELVDGTNIPQHTNVGDYGKWNRIANLQALSNSSFQSTFPVLSQYFGNTIINNFDSPTVDDGFMIMSMIDNYAGWGGDGDEGCFDAYIRFQAFDLTTCDLARFNVYQMYRKFNYDKTYIDYSTDGGATWRTYEINRKNIDVNVNNWAFGMKRCTLPRAVANQASVTLRLRYVDESDDNNGGYFCMFDDVTITTAPDNHLAFTSNQYFEGFYQMMPQGLQVPVVWASDFTNDGVYNQTNTVGKLYAMADGEDATVFASSNLGTVVALADSNRAFVIDPLGWYDSAADYHGWGFTDSSYCTGAYACLPTTEMGANFFFSDVNTSFYNTHIYDTLGTFDTVRYTVNYGTITDAAGQTRPAGIWARDHGVLTYNGSDASGNHYTPGIIASSANTWSDDFTETTWNKAGYSTLVSYVTGNVIPNGWRILGAELVASTTPGMEGVGANLYPMLWRDSVDGEGNLNFLNTPTGVTEYVVKQSDVNNTTNLTYKTIAQGYNTIRILFPNQPELKANTAYRIGYMLNEDADFSVATSRSNFVRGDSTVYFSEEPGMTDYSTVLTHNSGNGNFYSVMTRDMRTGSPVIKFFNKSVYPMIRMIVGPSYYIPKHKVSWECDNEDYGIFMTGNNESLCGESDSIAEGYSVSFYIQPEVGYEIDKITINGVETSDYTIEEDGEGNQYGIMKVENVTEELVFKCFFKEHIGFDPVANNVSMKLQPNPASSNVFVSLNGVSGNVNMSLIDMSGRVVTTSQFNAENGANINVSNLAKGAYFVRITNDKFSKVEKLIVR